MENVGLNVEKLVVGPLMSNCYIVWDEKTLEALIIDPGDNVELIVKKIKNLGLKVKLIVATHGHFDHVDGVEKLRKKTGADFLAHKNDFPDKEPKSDRYHRLGFGGALKPDRCIDEGDIISVGEYQFDVLHTPGHSQGSLCLLHNSIVFVGDVLFQGSIGRADLHGGSFEQLSNSIKSKLYTLSDETIVYTGHGPSTTIGDEKRYNAFVRS
ncbi:MAG: MBL fold metallo-hydrolase [Candidatus Thermoplasmatota archaeon]|nr:MBL fold metallo-hydrolase [Candidatus Thermoplasmatota archaeon]